MKVGPSETVLQGLPFIEECSSKGVLSPNLIFLSMRQPETITILVKTIHVERYEMNSITSIRQTAILLIKQIPVVLPRQVPARGQ